MGSYLSKQQTPEAGRQEPRRRRNSKIEESHGDDSNAEEQGGAQGGLGLEEQDEVTDGPNIIQARLLAEDKRPPLKTRIVVNGAELNEVLTRGGLGLGEDNVNTEPPTTTVKARMVFDLKTRLLPTGEVTRARDVGPELIPKDQREAAIKLEMEGLLKEGGDNDRVPHSTENYDKEAMKQMIKMAIMQYQEDRLERLHRTGMRNIADVVARDSQNGFLNSFPKSMEELVHKIGDSNAFMLELAEKLGPNLAGQLEATLKDQREKRVWEAEANTLFGHATYRNSTYRQLTFPANATFRARMRAGLENDTWTNQAYKNFETWAKKGAELEFLDVEWAIVRHEYREVVRQE